MNVDRWELADHLEKLTEAIEQRDRLALDAAWGVTGAVCGLQAAIVTMLAAYHLGASGGWWVFASFVAYVASLAAIMWANEQRMKEVSRLAPLPVWKRFGSGDE